MLGSKVLELRSGKTAVMEASQIQSLLDNTSNPPKDLVFKVGRTTGMTYGALNAVNSSIRMEYKVDGQLRIFLGELLLVVAPDGAPLWAGTELPWKKGVYSPK